jgi:peptide/nickel transport system permease protein
MEADAARRGRLEVGNSAVGDAKRRLGWVARQPLARVVAYRLLISVPLLFIVSALTFVLVALQPGDAAREILGLNGTPAQYRTLRQSLGLDKPLPEQYWHWLSHAFHGNLGISFVRSEPVSQEILQRLPVTISLIAGALIATALIGVSLGIFSAVRGGIAARVVDTVGMLGHALPSFWLAVVLIGLFAVKLGWFPAVGYVPLTSSPRDWLLSLALPVTAIALASIGMTAKLTREAMKDALSSDYIRMAWASGISPTSILFRHAFRNAAKGVVTVFNLMFIGLLAGTVFVESVFALPGLGGLAANAAATHDLPVLQGVVVFFTILIILVNLLTDLVYAWLDPRVRTG